MKFILVAALGATVSATLKSNHVPIQKSQPGWQLGTKGAEVKINMFYDVFCPDSKAAHYQLKSLMKKPSPVAGKLYEDILDMHVATVVLPYHLHSYKATQIIPYLQDNCANDTSKCQFEQYVELTWANLDWVLTANNLSDDNFVKGWAKTVSANLGVPEQEILDLYTPLDSHNTDRRVRQIWKYGTSVGVSGTPSAVLNGVKLDEVPATE
jgi:hypothetical protein